MKKLFNIKKSGVIIFIIVLIVTKIYTFNWAYDNENINYDYDENDKVTLLVILEEQTLLEYAKDDIYVEGFKRGQLTKEQLLKVDRLRKEIINKQINIKNSIYNICDSPKFINTYTLAFNGFSMSCKYKYIKEIKEIKGVKSVEINGVSETVELNKQEMSKMNVNINSYNESKYKGDNVIVAIIDDGIDYTHKDLQMNKNAPVRLTADNVVGKGKYYTKKVPYGYNFVSKSTDVKSNSTHGTAVAGIVGATGDGKDNSLRGVAPNVQLLALKVGDSTSKLVRNDHILAAIEEGIYQGADIINISIGAPGNPENKKEFLQLATMADDWGVIINISAGNYGASVPLKDFMSVKDISTINNMYLGNHHMVVGASKHSYMKNPVLSFVNKEKILKNVKYTYISGKSQDSGTYPLVESVYEDGEFDFIVSAKDKIVIISPNNARNKLGDTLDIVIRAYYDGAKGVILKEDNQYFLQELKESMIAENIMGLDDFLVLSVKSIDINSVDNKGYKELGVKIYDEDNRSYEERENSASQFSSYGPDDELNFKPSIIGPGVHMKTLSANDGYEIVNGTSFSCPYISGVCALVLNSLRERNLIPSWKNKQTNLIVNNIICNNANVLMFNKKELTNIYTQRLQGMGVSKIIDTVKADIIVESLKQTPFIELKEINRSDIKFNIRIRNISSDEKKVKLKHIGPFYTKDSLTEMTIDKNSNFYFGEKSINLEAGEAKDIECVLNLSKNISVGNFVEGLVYVEDEGKELIHHISYMGYLGKWDTINVFDEIYKNPKSIFNLTNIYKYNEKDNSFMPMNISTSIEIEKEHMSNLNIYIALLRNVKSIKCELYDETKMNLIKELSESREANKNIVNLNPIWRNNKMYMEDSKCGYGSNIALTNSKDVELNKGKYYIKVIAVATAHINKEDLKQIKWIPLEIK